MGKKIRLRESDLKRIINRIILETLVGPTASGHCECNGATWSNCVGSDGKCSKGCCEYEYSAEQWAKENPIRREKKYHKKMNNEEVVAMHPTTITPMGPGAIKPFSSTDGITQRRKPKGKSQEMNEGPICGNKSGEPCGEACGDGYSWQDSHASNSCICNHSNGKVCHNTGSGQYGGMYSDGGGGKIKGGELQNTGRGDSAISSLRHSMGESDLTRLIKKVINNKRK